MAVTTKGFKNRPAKRVRIQNLTAAATRLDISSKKEVERQQSIHKNWQYDSYVYNASIGEIRFATRYLANAAKRMRIFIAALPENGETDAPVDIKDLDNVPPDILEACQNAILDFGNGRTALAGHMKATSTCLSLAGEGYILGQEDPLTGQQTWSIRSINEIVSFRNKMQLREGPLTGAPDLGLIPLDPNYTLISRFWEPSPEYRLQADSPMRAILNECEGLLIYRRLIRALGRNRIAARGFLLFPDELEIISEVDDDGDPEASTLMQQLIDTYMTPISDEGSAAAVVPGLIRGPAEYLAAIRFLTTDLAFDAEARLTRDELLSVIATGLDLPKEVILGMSDLNKWSAYIVDENTFRSHIEPHIITICDCHTDGFLRPYLATSGVDEALLREWLPRLMFWYDPTELVTHPDQTQNATLLHAALALSDEAYRRVLGFSEADAPTAQEIEIRMIRVSRQYPMNLMMALMHELDPSLAVPPITTTGTVPGIKPGLGGGADVPPAPVEGMASPISTGAPVVTPTPPVAMPDADAAITAAGIVKGMGADARARFLAALRREFYSRYGFDYYEMCQGPTYHLTASAHSKKPVPSEKSRRLSRQLTAIDANLRAKVVTAANLAVFRQLEKAGGQVRTKVAANKELRTKIAKTRNEHVMMMLGQETVANTGLTASKLLSSDWESFKDQFMTWVEQAQRQAIAVAAKLAGVSDGTDDVWNQYGTKFGEDRDKAWSLMSDALTQIAQTAAYSPLPGVTEADAIAALNPDTIVPTGVVRAALGVAGGASEQDYGIITTKFGASVPAIPLGNQVGSVATGSTISNFLTTAGAVTDTYEWIHGPSDKPFPPHEALDGLEFSSFTDEALANDSDFPDNEYFLPGDHVGCLCDVSPLWVSPDDIQAAVDAQDASSGDDSEDDS